MGEDICTLIEYHNVWCVKYRHKVLLGDIDKKLKEILLVHLLIDYNPQLSMNRSYPQNVY